MPHTIDQLSAADATAIAAAAALLDAMSAQHTAALPEVFDAGRFPKASDYVRELLQRSDSRVFAARSGGLVVGVVHVEIRAAGTDPGWRQRRYGYIDAMYVLPDYRRQGIARDLVAAAHDWLRGCEVRKCELNVWAFNDGAYALYKDIGYTDKNINMWRDL